MYRTDAGMAVTELTSKAMKFCNISLLCMPNVKEKTLNMVRKEIENMVT
jgi:hypothetical protein